MLMHQSKLIGVEEGVSLISLYSVIDIFFVIDFDTSIYLLLRNTKEGMIRDTQGCLTLYSIVRVKRHDPYSICDNL